MLQIGSYEQINEDYIEGICMYDTAPLKQFASDMDKSENLRKIKGRFGYKTLIVMEKGLHFLAPYLPKTYFEKLNPDDYLAVDPNRYMLNKKDILEISSRLTASQRRDLQKAKENGRYLCLSKGKQTNIYIFMTSGRIYGMHSIKKSQKKEERNL